MTKILQLFFVTTFFTSIQGVCKDAQAYSTKCPHWARDGECTNSSGFMKIFCKKSCNECPGKYK